MRTEKSKPFSHLQIQSLKLTLKLKVAVAFATVVLEWYDEDDDDALDAETCLDDDPSTEEFFRSFQKKIIWKVIANVWP